MFKLLLALHEINPKTHIRRLVFRLEGEKAKRKIINELSKLEKPKYEKIKLY